MPTLMCSEDADQGSSLDTRLIDEDLKSRCTCGENFSSKKFGRTLSLDPQLLSSSRCLDCHKSKGKYTHKLRDNCIPEHAESRVHFGPSNVVTYAEGDDINAKLLGDCSSPLNTANVSDSHTEKIDNRENEGKDEIDCEKGDVNITPNYRRRRCKLTSKSVILSLIVSVLLIAVVLICGIYTQFKDKDVPTTSMASFISNTVNPPNITGCSQILNLNQGKVREDEESSRYNYRQYTLPWIAKTSLMSDVIQYHGDGLFNVTKSGVYAFQVDMNIDVYGWIGHKDLKKTFTSRLCLHFPNGEEKEKCTSKILTSRLIMSQSVTTTRNLEAGDSFRVSIRLETLKMIYLSGEKYNGFEIRMLNC